MKIINDSLKHPALFQWNGSVDETALSIWLAVRNLVLPKDIISFWVKTGGGVAFETETLLGPHGDQALGMDLDSVNDFQWKQGMSKQYYVFHDGVCFLSAIHLKDSKYVVINPNGYSVLYTFETFEDWYTNFIYSEYKDRYGL